MKMIKTQKRTGNHSGGDIQPHLVKLGFTIVEITVVLAVLLTLLSIGLYVYTGYNDWKLGAEAGTKLRQVYTAQRAYLAEHPTELPKSLSQTKILPYFSGAQVMPTVEDLDGNTLTINFKVSPPVVDDGSDGVYDPSGKSDDGQWDVGQ